MIIRYYVENYLSFNERIEFSMIPGRARKHPNHIVRDEAWDGINLLRSAVLYGANAAGKSNLVKSLAFMRHLVLNGTKPGSRIGLQCFKFASGCEEKPTRFEIEIKIDRRYYAYGFEITPSIVLSEWLYEIRKDRQKMLFERSTVDSETIVEFDKTIASDKKDLQFLEFIGKGTRPNQLFLTETRDHNVKQFRDVLHWFDNSLRIIFPDSIYRGLEFDLVTDEQVQKTVVSFLDHFNTGIADIGFKPVVFNDLPRYIRDDIEKNPEPGKTIVFRSPEGRFVVNKTSDNGVEASRMVAKHNLDSSDTLTDLEIEYESDGTQRLLDLIPALLSLAKVDQVFVIDELDRSLHPVLSYEILEYFLERVSDTNSQLIVTTHESNLLDLDLLRRDEIWFVEKDSTGASKLYSLEEFTPRYDKDIRKGYLQGRFGSIPILGELAGLTTGEGEKDAGKA